MERVVDSKQYYKAGDNTKSFHTRSLGAPSGYRGFAVSEGPTIPCDLSHGFRNYPIHFHINPVSMQKMVGRGECICFGVAERGTSLKELGVVSPFTKVSGDMSDPVAGIPAGKPKQVVEAVTHLRTKGRETNWYSFFKDTGTGLALLIVPAFSI